MKFKQVRVVAISLLTFLFTFSGCGVFTKKASKGKSDNPPSSAEKFGLKFNLTVDYFKDCEELQGNVRAQLTKKKKNDAERTAYYRWIDSISTSGGKGSSGSTMAASTSQSSPVTNDSASAPGAEVQSKSAVSTEAGKESFTNTQERGVDEADFVKIGTSHIYVLKDSVLEVVDRKSLKSLGKVTIDDVSIISLYVDDNRLIVLGYSVQNTPAAQKSLSYNDSYYPGSQTNTETKVKVFLAKEGQVPELEGEQTIKGELKDSRFIDGRLVLIFSPLSLPLKSGMQQYDLTTVEIPEEPIEKDNDERVSSVSCSVIAKPVTEDLDFRLTKVATLNTRDIKEDPQLTVAMGGGDDMYMSLSNLYLTKRSFEWSPWLSEGESLKRKESFVITKVHFDVETGQVGVTAFGEVAGRVKDQWAFKEFENDILAVATSTGDLWDHSGPNIAQNHLWILKPEGESLNVAASINDFGTGEDIRSIRYVGATAYVVTFKKTDPLFAFDLANPLEPKLLGELKVPGFSVYMHPVGPDRILGVGFDAEDQGDFAWYQGLQVSLFDVSNPLDMKRIDNKIIGDRGSYSDVTSDHHAFFFDEETKLVSVSAVELVGKESTGGPEMGNKVAFSGAILYRIETDKLTEVARITHKDLIPAECQSQLAYPQWWQNVNMSLDINRVYKVDGRLLSISRFGIKTHSIDQPETSETAISFDNPQSMCSEPGRIVY